MQLGMIGLGRMGANMIRRVMQGRSRVRRGTDLAAAGAAMAQRGRHRRRLARGPGREAGAAAARVGDGPRRPARRRTRSRRCAALLDEGDTVIDGGNSYFKDDVRRAKLCAEHGIHYVDVGTRGGVWGLERGYCLMIGGPDEVVQRIDPIFRALAPGDRAHRAHARAQRRPGHGRAGLPPLRPGRLRALREDGAQRHRVRRDAGLRRGLRHHEERRRRSRSPGPSLRAPTARHRRALAAQRRSSARGCST